MNRKFRTRAQSAKNSGTSKADLEEILSGIEDLADDALDPELSREEVVAKVKEIYDLAEGEADEEDEEDE